MMKTVIDDVKVNFEVDQDGNATVQHAIQIINKDFQESDFEADSDSEEF
jgi:KaiC/GvpD/RAD55 family RecA-like ATPase